MPTTQMIIRLDANTKTNLSKLARSEGKNTSQVVRELIEKYVQDRNIDVYIDDLWNRVGQKLKAQNVKEDDIKRVIRDVRAVKK